MAELKTKQTEASFENWINPFVDTERKESFELMELMTNVTGFQPKMWGLSMIGLGYYHYKFNRSCQEDD